MTHSRRPPALARLALRDCASPDCRILASSRSAQVAREAARGAEPLTLDVLDREIKQMEHGQQYATSAEPTPFWDARLINYAFACGTFFDLRGRYETQIAWSEAGRQAAQRQGSREMQRLSSTILQLFTAF
jgi:hypothetical protein